MQDQGTGEYEAPSVEEIETDGETLATAPGVITGR